MSEVKRYSVKTVYSTPTNTTTGHGPISGFVLDEDKRGKIILHSDHLAAMEALREAKDREIARLTAICTAAGIPTTTEEV